MDSELGTDDGPRAGGEAGRPAPADTTGPIPVGARPSTQAGDVVVYWRPGCPWCALLRRRLRRAGIETIEVDIWKQPEAAAVVRSITGGDETVPTVVVGGAGLVNPTVGQVRAALQALGGQPGA